MTSRKDGRGDRAWGLGILYRDSIFFVGGLGLPDLLEHVGRFAVSDSGVLDLLNKLGLRVRGFEPAHTV